MIIDENLLEHLANLAKIKLNENEKQKLLSDLNKILEMVHTINKIDLSNVTPFKYTNLQNLVFRDDSVGKSLTQEEALKNSKDVVFPFFKVPKVIK